MEEIFIGLVVIGVVALVLPYSLIELISTVFSAHLYIIAFFKWLVGNEAPKYSPASSSYGSASSPSSSSSTTTTTTPIKSTPVAPTPAPVEVPAPKKEEAKVHSAPVVAPAVVETPAAAAAAAAATVVAPTPAVAPVETPVAVVEPTPAPAAAPAPAPTVAAPVETTAAVAVAAPVETPAPAPAPAPAVAEPVDTPAAAVVAATTEVVAEAATAAEESTSAPSTTDDTPVSSPAPVAAASTSSDATPTGDAVPTTVETLADGKVQETVTIPGALFKYVIGNKGANIKKIQEETKTRVNLEQENNVAKVVGAANEDTSAAVKALVASLAEWGWFYDSSKASFFEINANDKVFSGYRQPAEDAAKKRGEAFAASKVAFEAGDKALAKEHSEKGKEYDALFKEAQAEAAKKIFEYCNKDKDEFSIDLHGLLVQEAMTFLEERYQKLKATADAAGKTFYVITGAGNHSDNNVAKIKPTVIEHFEKNSIAFTHEKNGVLAVVL